MSYRHEGISEATKMLIKYTWLLPSWLWACAMIVSLLLGWANAFLVCLILMYVFAFMHFLKVGYGAPKEWKVGSRLREYDDQGIPAEWVITKISPNRKTIGLCLIKIRGRALTSSCEYAMDSQFVRSYFHLVDNDHTTFSA